jgi:hypothetical protein
MRCASRDPEEPIGHTGGESPALLIACLKSDSRDPFHRIACPRALAGAAESPRVLYDALPSRCHPMPVNDGREELL